MSQPDNIFFFVRIDAGRISEYDAVITVIILATLYFGSLDLTFYDNEIFGSVYHRLMDGCD